MATLVPRAPYSQEELEKLYPQDLELRLVQVLLRHGERAPVSVRFQNVSRSYTFRDFIPWSTWLTQVLGRSCTLLALLQRCPTNALRCHDPPRRFQVEFITMAEKTGKI
jgi:hypothetical protein